MGCRLSSNESRFIAPNAADWPSIPLRLELPNFMYFHVGRDGEIIVDEADELSAIREMKDKRLIKIGSSEEPPQLHLDVRTQRTASILRVKDEEDGVPQKCCLLQNEEPFLVASANFSVGDVTPKAQPHAQDVELLQSLMPWQPGEECSKLQVFNMAGSPVCNVDYHAGMLIAEAKDRITQHIGKAREAQFLSAIDASTLQVAVRELEVKALFPTPLQVKFVTDSNQGTTRLCQLSHTETWDVELDDHIDHNLVALSRAGVGKTYTIQRIAGEGVGTTRRATIDRRPRTAIAKDMADQCVAHASVTATSPDALETFFEGRLRYHPNLSIEDSATQTLFAALGLVIAGVDCETWLKRRAREVAAWNGAGKIQA
mmetsp:Transcript_39166/g.61004  ORF Transcript_39166/g.61004 Transcript_39166/m.61004 type:complete len:372 (+) Transcript_39166:21-1136(+)